MGGLRLSAAQGGDHNQPQAHRRSSQQQGDGVVAAGLLPGPLGFIVDRQAAHLVLCSVGPGGVPQDQVLEGGEIVRLRR